MNTLIGKISQIQQTGSILLVDIDVNGHNFSALLIESTTHLQWLRVENNVHVIFKETEVSLAKNLTGSLSIRNRMPCKVQHIERGELLSKLTLSFNQHTIVSAITTRAVDALKLNINDTVEALVKSNEISLMKITD